MDGEAVVQDILEHHGVKGMKWGVRRDRTSGSSSSGSGSGKTDKSVVKVKTVVHPQVKTVLRTSGGRGIPAHPDAVAARIVQQKLKKSGMHAVSNAELQTYNNRMNLETNAKRLTPDTHAQAGIKYATNFLKSPEGQKTAISIASKISKKRVAKGVAKAAMVAAMA